MSYRVSYLCVDGGQTQTAVALLGEEGTEIRAWEAGPLTTPSKPGALEDLRGVVRGIAEELRAILADSGAPPPRAACFSLTGYMYDNDRVPSLVREEMKRVVPALRAVHTIPDYVGNWAAATGGRPGVVVISGGGAVAYGRTASGSSLRVGGWGHLLGDEGSGYWIGLEAIKAVLKSWAGVIPPTALEAPVMQTFGTDGDREVLRKVYSGSFSEAEIAGLVPHVVSVAKEGDETADRILDEAARNLAGIVGAVFDNIGVLPVYPTGGVFLAPTARERFGEALSNSWPGAVIIDTVAPNPLDGVFLIAREGLP